MTSSCSGTYTGGPTVSCSTAKTLIRLFESIISNRLVDEQEVLYYLEQFGQYSLR